MNKIIKNIFFDKSESYHNNFVLLTLITFFSSIWQFVYQYKINSSNIHEINIFFIINLIQYCLIGYFFNYILLFVIDKCKGVSELFDKVILKGLIIIISFLFLIDAFLIYQFDGILDQTKITIMLSVDYYTIQEFLFAYVFSNKFIIIFFLLIIFALLFIFYKKITFKPPQIKTLNILSKPCFMVSILFLILVFKASINSDENAHVLERIFSMSSSINRLILDSCFYVNNTADKNLIFNAFDSNSRKIIENNANIPYVIFVLGSL